MENKREYQEYSDIDRRSLQDRRKKTNKNYKPNRRGAIRRQEDRENNITYYLALIISFATIATFFVVSILYR